MYQRKEKETSSNVKTCNVRQHIVGACMINHRAPLGKRRVHHLQACPPAAARASVAMPSIHVIHVACIHPSSRVCKISSYSSFELCVDAHSLATEADASLSPFKVDKA